MIRLCFVCLGNICRSPTAEGVMQQLIDSGRLADKIQIDSAGTIAHHTGEAADARSREHAQRRGIELRSIARQIRDSDFQEFDYLLAMDESNLSNLHAHPAATEASAAIQLFRDFDTSAGPRANVPDPYYGGDAGFEEVLDMCERACQGILDHLKANSLV